MKALTLLLALFAMTSSAGRPPLACDLHALTKAERERHGALTKQLRAAVTPAELRNGYALSFDRTKLPIEDAAQWIAFESRCCPFVDFTLEVPANGSARLRLTGNADVKKFLKAELGM